MEDKKYRHQDLPEEHMRRSDEMPGKPLLPEDMPEEQYAHPLDDYRRKPADDRRDYREDPTFAADDFPEDRYVDEPYLEEPYRDETFRPERDSEEPPRETAWQKAWEWIKVLVAAVVIGLLITTFVMQRNTVSGVSMTPTLQPKDELIVEKVSKWFGGIKRGDIITVHMENPALRDGEANIIKRVIGLPGDHVLIENGQVFVNGELLVEDYLPADTVTDAFGDRHKDVKLGEEEYFVMGDNRAQSLDSRRFGPVVKGEIIGEVLVRIYPFNSFGSP